ncbi:hypothetical protein GCM10023317_33110 [Actinopolymorpha pittospori]
MWVAGFCFAGAADEFGGSVVVEDLEEGGPVGQVEAVDEAGGSIGEDCGPSRGVGGYGSNQGVSRALRFGGGDPESVGCVERDRLIGLIARGWPEQGFGRPMTKAQASRSWLWPGPLWWSG